jgi:hypothetical protein
MALASPGREALSLRERGEVWQKPLHLRSRKAALSERGFPGAFPSCLRIACNDHRAQAPAHLRRRRAGRGRKLVEVFVPPQLSSLTRAAESISSRAGPGAILRARSDQGSELIPGGCGHAMMSAFRFRGARCSVHPGKDREPFPICLARPAARPAERRIRARKRRAGRRRAHQRYKQGHAGATMPGSLVWQQSLERMTLRGSERWFNGTGCALARGDKDQQPERRNERSPDVIRSPWRREAKPNEPATRIRGRGRT